jgi:hypothetical protein
VFGQFLHDQIAAGPDAGFAAHGREVAGKIRGEPTGTKSTKSMTSGTQMSPLLQEKADSSLPLNAKIMLVEVLAI